MPLTQPLAADQVASQRLTSLAYASPEARHALATWAMDQHVETLPDNALDGRDNGAEEGEGVASSSTSSAEASRDWAAAEGAAAAAAAVEVAGFEETACEESGMDKSLLQDKTQPILLFDDLRLFSHPLKGGEVVLSAKVRVMPTCFFILVRCWVRMGRAGVRVAENRIFHRLGSGVVSRDFEERAVLWPDILPSHGLPDDPASFVESSSIVAALPLAGPPRTSQWLLKASDPIAVIKASLVAQTEYYFSDENLPGDKFLIKELQFSADGMVSLAVVGRFNKMKKLLTKLAKKTGETKPGGILPVLADLLRSSTKLAVSEDGK